MKKRIAVIGNSGGGKTVLCRRLSQLSQIPVTHVDALQFLPGLKIRPHHETISSLNIIMQNESWIIDGFGPLDILEKRFGLSDQIIFLDLPLWRHLWWCTKRQIKNIWSPRVEIPANCNEATWEQTVKLFKSVWKVHHLMRPELLRILNRPEISQKVIIISTLPQWKRLYKKGVDGLN